MFKNITLNLINNIHNLELHHDDRQETFFSVLEDKFI